MRKPGRQRRRPPWRRAPRRPRPSSVRPGRDHVSNTRLPDETTCPTRFQGGYLDVEKHAEDRVHKGLVQSLARLPDLVALRPPPHPFGFSGESPCFLKVYLHFILFIFTCAWYTASRDADVGAFRPPPHPLRLRREGPFGFALYYFMKYLYYSFIKVYCIFMIYSCIFIIYSS